MHKERVVADLFLPNINLAFEISASRTGEIINTESGHGGVRRTTELVGSEISVVRTFDFKRSTHGVRLGISKIHLVRL